MTHLLESRGRRRNRARFALFAVTLFALVFAATWIALAVAAPAGGAAQPARADAGSPERDRASRNGARTMPPPIVPAQPAAAAARAAENSAAMATPQDLRLIFFANSPALTLEATEQLEKLASALNGNSRRLELRSYAGSPDRAASDNRRLALKRALSVRSYLMERRIDAMRVDLHAIGSAPDDGPPERVDVVLLKP